MAFLQVEKISKSFDGSGGRSEVLHDVSFTLAEGESLGLIGLSGVGKSTLLSIMGGFLHPDRGEVRIGEKQVLSPGNGTVMVFQEDAVFPWMRVRQNVIYGCNNSRGPRSEKQVTAALAEVDLSLDGDPYPSELSVGMRKRVELARALMADPDLILADEPFAHIDVATRHALEAILTQARLSRGSSMVLATHDVESAIWLSSKVALLTGEPASIADVISLPWEFPRSRELRFTDELQQLRRSLEERLAEARRNRLAGHSDA